MCAVPLVFQSFEEWQASELGLHPVQVALQVSLPEIDGAIEPIIFAGREGATGRSVPLADRVNLLADRAMKWATLNSKPAIDKKIAITMEKETLARLDRLVEDERYPSRSRAIQEAVEEKLSRLDRTRLIRESAKLDPDFEQRLADEGSSEDLADWPDI